MQPHFLSAWLFPPLLLDVIELNRPLFYSLLRHAEVYLS